MRYMPKSWMAGIIVALFASSALAAGSAEAGKAKAAVCMACHGADGNSPTDMWPKLAGQLPEYLVKQLHDFKSGRRKNEQMSPMAQPLSDQDILDVAAFFASQKVVRTDGPKDLVAAGEKLFQKGKGRPDTVPACMGCHGPAGGGKTDWVGLMKVPPTTLAPAIGGQHAAYTANQLKAYRTAARNNDEAHVMRDIAGRLTDAEIAAVAQYVATLSR